MILRERVAEEYSLGPTTLEDAYVRLIDTGDGTVDGSRGSGRLMASIT